MNLHEATVAMNYLAYEMRKLELDPCNCSDRNGMLWANRSVTVSATAYDHGRCTARVYYKEVEAFSSNVNDARDLVSFLQVLNGFDLGARAAEANTAKCRTKKAS